MYTVCLSKCTFSVRLTRTASLVAAAIVVAVAASQAVAAKIPRPARVDRDPQTLLVKFDRPTGAEAKVAATGDQVVGKAFGDVLVVRIPPGIAVAEKVGKYRQRSDVAYAEPNYVRQATLAAPNDPGFSALWGLSSIDAVPGWSLYPGAFMGGPSPPIAVVDTGVNASHPDLYGKVLTSLGATCTSPSYTCTASSASDVQGHGTHVAGTAGAAVNNGVGVAGLAFSSSILPVRVLDATGSGSDAGVANGITWAANHGAKVINLSLGGYGPFPTTLCNAVSYAVYAGVVVVAAAGNEGTDAESYPAACPGAIGVAANAPGGVSPDWSNYGNPDVFISAPGVDIYSTLSGGGYGYKSGTSMATPHVAGLAALLLGQKASRTTAAIRMLLAQSANKVGPYSYGADPYGTCACSWHPYYGYGEIDVDTALSIEPITPTIGSMTPSVGSVGSEVTLTGSNFSGVSAVTLYGVNASFTVVSPTEIRAFVPAIGVPQARWRVVTSTGTAVYDPLFTVTPPPAPVISGLSSLSGPVGSEVTITGSNFVGVSAVTLYAISASFTVVSPTEIRAFVPAIGVPQARWRVTTPGGTALYDPLFTVTPPMISGLSPLSGPVGSGVTITGSSFVGVSAVTLYGISASFTVVSPTEIRATVPAIGVPQARWRVTTPGGTAVYDPLFTVTV
jgi:subtilisin family serine protease